MKIVQTIEKVIYFQRMVKQYFGKKRLWEAQIYVEIDKERLKMRDFIKINMRGQQRLKYDWLVDELNEVEDAHMKQVCKNLVQYIKDLHVLDTYRYNYISQGSRKTAEVIDGAKSNILRTENLYIGHYRDPELKRYPCRLESDTGKAKDVKVKKRSKTTTAKGLDGQASIAELPAGGVGAVDK